MAEKRKAVVAGQFYPDEKAELETQVKKFLVNKKRKEVKAVIVPHAGYIFSGELAGKVISLIKSKKNFIILGVNHSGFGNKLSFSERDFETPLGNVKNNVDLSRRILERLKKEDLDVNINERAHQFEHSIEVQLPFLQLSQKKFDIAPILLRGLSYEECRKVALILASFVSDDTCIVVSSDFTHYGFSYGFVPFTSDVKENLYKLDKEIINEILALNSRKVYGKASKSTVCGVLGITVLTELAKIKKLKPKLVDYYTSGDISGDFNNAVGYAGLIFI